MAMHRPGASGGSEDEVMAPDVVGALREFSSALSKHTMYPREHPVLIPIAESLRTQLGVSLLASKRLTIQVGRDRLEVGGVATEPSDHLLSALANRLHHHGIESLTFRRGIKSEELSGLLEALAQDVEVGGEGHGVASVAESNRWRHIKVRLLSYDPLTLSTAEEAPEGLWMGLDSAPFHTDVAGLDVVEATANEVARVIQVKLGSEVRDRTIAVEIFRLAEDLKTASGKGAEILSERMSELVFSLDPGALAHLLKLGADGDRTNRFLRDSAEWMEAEAIIELIKTAGENRRDAIAPWLIRLTSKLASYTPRGERAHRSESDCAVRNIVKRMIDEWELKDPRPDDYTEELTRYSMRPPNVRDEATPEHSVVEPERTLRVSIELDEPNELARWAAGHLVSGGSVATLVDLLEGAPDDSRVTPPLWRGISTPHVLRQLLEVDEPNFNALDRIIEKVGLSGAESMLDVLARSKVRSVRRYIFDKLAVMDPEVGRYVVKRIDDPRWYVVRNMLGLLRTLQVWPEDFDVDTYLHHADHRVRLEALSLALQRPEHRERAICLALADPDERVIAVGLAEAAASCPPAAERMLIRHLRDRRRPEDFRVRAIVALGTLGSHRAVKAIAGACMRRTWLFRKRLSSEASIVAAAVSLLASRWPNTRVAERVLRLAATSLDSDPWWGAASEAAPDVTSHVAPDTRQPAVA